MTDYLNPSRIYTDRLGVSKMESTTDNELVITPTVKESLAVRSGNDNATAPVDENCRVGEPGYPTAMSRERAAEVLELLKNELHIKFGGIYDRMEPYQQAVLDALETGFLVLRQAANGQQVKNGTGIEEIEWAKVNLQVGTAKPRNETVPNPEGAK